MALQTPMEGSPFSFAKLDNIATDFDKINSLNLRGTKSQPPILPLVIMCAIWHGEKSQLRRIYARVSQHTKSS